MIALVALLTLKGEPGLHQFWVAVKPYETADGDFKQYLRFEPSGRYVSTLIDLKTHGATRRSGVYRVEPPRPGGSRIVSLYESFEDARQSGASKKDVEAARVAGLPGFPIIPRYEYLEKVPALTNLVNGFAPVNDVDRVRGWFERH